MKFFRYLYYRIYTWNYNNWGASDQPQFNAMFGVMFLIFSNLFTLVELYLALRGLASPNVTKEVEMVLVIVMCLLFLIGYFSFIKNGKFHYIVAEFQHESKDDRRKGTIKNMIYVVLSFLLPLIIAKFYRAMRVF